MGCANSNILEAKKFQNLKYNKRMSSANIMGEIKEEKLFKLINSLDMRIHLMEDKINKIQTTKEILYTQQKTPNIKSFNPSQLNPSKVKEALKIIDQMTLDKPGTRFSQQDYYKWLADPDQFQFNALTTYASCTQDGPHSIDCKQCKRSHFIGIRLVCLTCQNFNLCGNCFELDNSHDPSHPFILLIKKLSAKGKDRLEKAVWLIQSKSEQLVNYTWKSYCQQCNILKESIFFTNSETGKNICKQCFLKYSSKHQETYVTTIFPVSSKIIFQQITRNKRTFGDIICYQKITLNTRPFLLSTISLQVSNMKAYYESRNYLIRVKGQTFQNVLAFEEEINEQRVHLRWIEEWPVQQSLDLLIQSSAFKNLNYLKKIHLIMSLGQSVQKIHKMALFHGYLAPQIILLNKQLQVRLQLTPFVNLFAIIKPSKKVLLYREAKPSKESDIYALGLIANLVLTGSEHKIVEGKAVMQKAKILNDLIEECTGDVKNRPSAQDFVEDLEDFMDCFNSFVNKQFGQQNFERKNVQQKNIIIQEFYARKQ